MKRLVFLLVGLLLVSACASPVSVNQAPPATRAALTLAAMPRLSTNTPLPTDTPTPTTAPPVGPPTPALDLTIPGAYCLPTNTNRSRVLVTRIIDGETIEVASTFQTFIVRYIGIDAPNLSPAQEWQAAQAYGYNTNLVSGKNVTLVEDMVNQDPATGVYLRYVIADNAFVNYEIVRQGFAKVSSMPPNSACDNAFIAAQVEAQAAISGMWQPTPLPTWTNTPTPTITFTPGPVTPTSPPPCSCDAQKTCSQFQSQRQAQACYNYCIRNFNTYVLRDNNNNGLVCEGLP
jgi:micrococcal nuclease